MTKDGTAEFIAVDARAAAIFDLIYPVGSIFATTGNAPARGTWEEIAQGRTLQGADSSHAAGTTIEAGLPNITGGFIFRAMERNGDIISSGSGAFNTQRNNAESVFDYIIKNDTNTSSYKNSNCIIDASRCSALYGASTTVQPPAYVVHFYRRTA